MPVENERGDAQDADQRQDQATLGVLAGFYVDFSESVFAPSALARKNPRF
jgi:hypothetical protein